MYRIEYTHTAKRQITKIDKRYARSIIKKIGELRYNPLMGKKLHDDLKEYRSIREGVYRIIYQSIDKKLVILIITIGHRQSVYKKIR